MLTSRSRLVASWHLRAAAHRPGPFAAVSRLSARPKLVTAQPLLRISFSRNYANGRPHPPGGTHLSRLIGSPAGYVGYEDAGQLTEAVRRKPYAVLLFDEFEKAHRDISALLLQVLDEGFLTDSHGNKVDFRNTIIVLTSNLGAEILVNENALAEEIGGSEKIPESTRKAIMDVVSSCYPPEFLNRIDEFIVFQRLSKSALREIVGIRLKELQQRLDDRRIRLEVDQEVQGWLCEKSYDPRYGARPLNRLTAKEVGNRLADKIIRGELKGGLARRYRLFKTRLVSAVTRCKNAIYVGMIEMGAFA